MTPELQAFLPAPESMGDPFEAIARGVIGRDLELRTPHGTHRMIYADWTASGRLYQPIEELLLREVALWIANAHTETSATGRAMTLAYHHARDVIKRHVNASVDDVLLATGTGRTGAINKLQRMLGIRVPSSFIGEARTRPEDRPLVLVTHMEHHSNHTTWLECEADLAVIPASADGLVDLSAIPTILARHADRRMKIVAITACSNVTGIATPFHEIAALMHAHGGCASWTSPALRLTCRSTCTRRTRRARSTPSTSRRTSSSAAPAPAASSCSPAACTRPACRISREAAASRGPTRGTSIDTTRTSRRARTVAPRACCNSCARRWRCG